MTFSHFSRSLATLESTSSRLEMTEQLAIIWQRLESDEIVKTSYLLQGSLVPSYESLEFQLSVKMVLRALARIVRTDNSARPSEMSLFGDDLGENAEALSLVTAWYKEIGDVGLVAEKVCLDKSVSELKITDVYDELRIIAVESGAGSQERKVDGLVKLFSQLDGLSCRYVARIIIGRLRLGFSTMTMLDALSWAMTGSKAESGKLEDAYNRKADIGLLAQTYLAEKDGAKRLAALDAYQVAVGVPVVPALCQRLNSAAEIIDKLGEVFAEPKYDGLRLQIHIAKTSKAGSRNEKSSVEIKAYTRNLEEVTKMFPELAEGVSHLNCDSCIIDAEAIAFNKQTGELVAFQETITRKRKHDVGEKAQELPVRFYVFDVLSIDGNELIDKKLRDRKDVLKKLISKNEVYYETDYIVTSDPHELRSFHEAQLGKGLEGAVLKSVDSPYQSGRKGWHWVKIKEEEGTTGKLADTLDLIVMGYYVGRGKRTTFGIGAILVGLLKEDQVVTIAKIGTGLSDEQLREMKKRCDGMAVKEKPHHYVVDKSLVPDVWVSPEIVLEIAADEITTSPVHSAGVALRFPRLVKVRDDKNPEQATTWAEVEKMI